MFARRRRPGRCSGPGCPGPLVFRPVDLIRSHDLSAGEGVGGGGNTAPTSDVLIQGGHIPTITTAMRGKGAHLQPHEGSSPSSCSCGANADRPGDEYCKAGFEAALNESLASRLTVNVIADSW
jgi:hypothetical protein